ncbi:MAG TPA: spermine synthase [Gammaproteobacteria bacterium]|nr:spermine synthase [Gammaproteobacteria bacterium]
MTLLYGLSGLTSLAFEVLWARMLSLQFGVSTFGVVITVAAFMAGLGLGSLVGLKMLQWARRPLRWLAALEGGIALYALALPWGFRWLDGLLGHIAEQVGLDGWQALQAIALTGFMLVPALAMGMGFPLVLASVRDSNSGLGRLYGANAAGAALGALLPLYLLPTMGWSRAVQAVAGLGMVVAVGAALLAARAPCRPEGAARRPARRSHLLAYAMVGAGAIALEIGWTRLFGMVLLRTEYVLAVILAVYLLGIGLGSLLARHLRAPLWLSLFPAVAALTAVATLWALPYLSRWVEAAHYDGLAAALWQQGLALAAITLPATLVLGAWLPLLARLEEDDCHGARLYGANSLGAAAGAVLAGFVLIPWLGTSATILAAALVVFAAGMRWTSHRLWWLALVPLMVLAWPVRVLPPVASLLPGTHGGSRDLFFHEDAMSITHVLARPDGQRLLLSDLQRMDAASDPTSVALQKNQARLGLLLRPGARRVLFLGLGTGISASGALPLSDLEITAVELSRGSILAAERWFGAVNDDVMQHIMVHQDDARRFLRATGDRYDLIVGDVFHPDLVGRSALLSVQQFQRVRDRLAPGGLFVQWLALNQFDRDALATVLRSFYRIFPKGVLFMDGFRMALVGPRTRLPAISDIVTAYRKLPARLQEAVSGGEGLWTWLGRYWGAPRPDPGPVEDEWRPHIEYSLPHARFQGGGQLRDLLGWLVAHRPPLDDAARRLAVPADGREAFERGYVATEFMARSWQARLAGRGDETYRLIRFAYEANARDRWAGFALADAMMASLDQARRHGLDERRAVESVLRIRPDHPEALHRAWALARAAGDGEAAAAYLERLRRLSPLDRTVAGRTSPR